MEGGKKKQKELNKYEKFLQDMKTNFKAERKPSYVHPMFLNEKQKKAFDCVFRHVNSKTRKPLRLHISGIAGSGKSLLLNALRPLFEANKVKYEILSYTGSSAFVISGKTIHRSFQLPWLIRNGDPTSNLESVRKSLKDVKYFIFDEKSLIGLYMFGFLARRLQAIYNDPEHLGSRSLILLGDFGQLSPVADKALYKFNDENLAGLELVGAEAYKTFQTSVVLNVSMRIQEDIEFNEILNRVRHGQINESDIKLLQEREVSRVPVDDHQEFIEKGVFLFPSRDCVAQYNDFRISALGTDVIEFPNQDSNAAPTREIPMLKLALDAPVALTRNLHVPVGLHNAARGTVTGFSEELCPDTQKPICVMVKFDHYYGPKFEDSSSVPICMMPQYQYSSELERGFTTKQFPLELSFAHTIHRSQGLTLPKVILGQPPLGSSLDSMYFRDAPILFYTALSRCRKLSDVMFSAPFNPNIANRTGSRYRQWMDEERRISEMEID